MQQTVVQTLALCREINRHVENALAERRAERTIVDRAPVADVAALPKPPSLRRAGTRALAYRTEPDTDRRGPRGDRRPREHTGTDRRRTGDTTTVPLGPVVSLSVSADDLTLMSTEQALLFFSGK